MLQEAPYSINQAFATNPHYAKKKNKNQVHCSASMQSN